MSPRSLFIIILRIIGILWVKNAVLALFQMLTNIYFYTQLSDQNFLLSTTVSQIIVTIVYFLVCWALIFKAGYIVDRLKLSHDITPVLQFKLDKRDSIRIVLVVTGALIIVSQVPEFVANLAHMFDRQPREMYDETNVRSWTPVFVSGVQMLIGLLIIGERATILGILLKDQANNPTDDPEQPVAGGDQDLFSELH